MTLKGQYNDALLSDLLLTALKQGSVPNVDELKDQLAVLEAAKPLLGTKPLLSLEDHRLEFFENASATKWNDLMISGQRDLGIMYDLIAELQDRTINQGRRWSAYWTNGKRLLDDLEDRVDTVLLLKRDTLGYYKYVSDDFFGISLVDTGVTDARVDTAAGVVTMQEISTASGEVARIDTTGATVSRQTLQAPGLIAVATEANSGVGNAITDQYSEWIELIRTSDQGNVTVALTIDLGTPTTISKAIFTPAGSTATSAYVVTMMYSPEGIDYVVVPAASSQSITTNPAVWSFGNIQATKVRFIISKNGYDDIDPNGNYGYIMGCKNVSLFNPAYDITQGSVFQSTDLEVLDDQGVALSFSKCALHTCQTLPLDTRIDYSVSVDGSAFIAISPIEESAPSHPQVIDFAEAVLVNNNNQLTVWNTGLSSNALDLANTGTLNLEDPNDVVLNYYVPVGDVASVREATYRVWRNLGQQGVNVRGQASGWFKDETRGTFKTWFSVEEPGGVDVNLGGTRAKLNGVTVYSAVHIPKGIHSWETDFANWAEVASGYTDEAALEANDPLYPYNHKLIIEGYTYSGFTGDQVYVGMVWWAESSLQYSPLHEFFGAQDPGTLNLYTRETDLSGNLGFVVKTTQAFGDHANEQFRIQYELTDRLFTSITLRAILGTAVADTSPVIDSYTLKLG